MSLKIKAAIFRYTGIFLAYKEQSEYLESDEFWTSYHNIAFNPENDMNASNIQGMLIGCWQANYGFYRPAFRHHYSKYFKFVGYIKECYYSVWWDIKKLW